MSTFSLMLRRGAAILLILALTLLLAACAADDGGNGGDDGGSPDAGGGSGTATVSGGTVEVAADNLQFDVNTIEAPADEAFTITLVNNDTAPHNISIYREEGGEEIVVGDVINGGETVEVEVPALEAGEYYFVCDIHPEMNGTVVVGG